MESLRLYRPLDLSSAACFQASKEAIMTVTKKEGRAKIFFDLLFVMFRGELNNSAFNGDRMGSEVAALTYLVQGRQRVVFSSPFYSVP